ncbi:PBECR2 nuclease fold domain-containing protein [Castellaniella hirudinis]|uniref:PBECR2 nuclease fold domain-containing protein n=1 Tax=Castellaniella hirudinis TaxID=1144617 RepID=UPI0039C44012
MAASYGSLPFREQSEFFRRKLNIGTTSWADIYAAEHDWAFMVAGANRDAIVSDFRTAVEKAINDGTTLEQFRADFDAIVARHGWDYNGSRGWRSKVIYETNLRTSYAAGRYEQMQAVKAARPYWRYNHSEAVEHPRHEHLVWNGLVLSADDPWWREHYPPNGWGCQCYVTTHTDRDLDRMGKTGPDTAPHVETETRVVGKNSETGPHTVQVPKGVDPGFEYTPGRSRLDASVPTERPEGLAGSAASPGVPNRRPLDTLPPPRPFEASRILPAGAAPETYVQRYLQEFGATIERPAIVRDVLGERLVVGADLFRDAHGRWKVTKRGREQYLLMLADALRDPDEVWVRIEWLYSANKAVVRRRYVARYDIEGQAAPALSVFEIGPDGWSGITAFQGQTQSEDDWRVGVRLYRRQP